MGYISVALSLQQITNVNGQCCIPACASSLHALATTRYYRDIFLESKFKKHVGERGIGNPNFMKDWTSCFWSLSFAGSSG